MDFFLPIRPLFSNFVSAVKIKTATRVPRLLTLPLIQNSDFVPNQTIHFLAIFIMAVTAVLAKPTVEFNSHFTVTKVLKWVFYFLQFIRFLCLSPFFSAFLFRTSGLFEVSVTKPQDFFSWIMLLWNFFLFKTCFWCLRFLLTSSAKYFNSLGQDC